MQCFLVIGRYAIVFQLVLLLPAGVVRVREKKGNQSLQCELLTHCFYLVGATFVEEESNHKMFYKIDGYSQHQKLRVRIPFLLNS